MATTNAQIASWAENHQALTNEIAELQAAQAKLRDMLLSHVPVNTTLVAGGRRIIHTRYEQKSLNTALLREQAPDVYEEFLKVEERTKLIVR